MMNKCLASFVLGLALCGSVVACSAQQTTVPGGDISLPTPVMTGGMPLMEAFSARKTTRKFDVTKPVSDQLISELLWSAWGINRPDGKRTVPTARDKRDMEVYLVKAEGAWRYEPESNKLVKVSDENLCFGQMKTASFSLVFAGPEGVFPPMHAGSMYQNAGLYAASKGLGNVVLGMVANQLQGKLPVKDGYKVIVAQAFGWPQE